MEKCITIEEIQSSWSEIITDVKETNDLTELFTVAWLRPLTPCLLDGETLVVETLNDATKGYIGKRFKAKLETSVKNIVGINVNIVFCTMEEAN